MLTSCQREESLIQGGSRDWTKQLLSLNESAVRVAYLATGLPQTSNLETATKPPTPWPEPGISCAQPISSTLDRSGFSTQVPRVTVWGTSSFSHRSDDSTTSFSI